MYDVFSFVHIRSGKMRIKVICRDKGYAVFGIAKRNLSKYKEMYPDLEILTDNTYILAK